MTTFNPAMPNTVRSSNAPMAGSVPHGDAALTCKRSCGHVRKEGFLTAKMIQACLHREEACRHRSGATGKTVPVFGNCFFSTRRWIYEVFLALSALVADLVPRFLACSNGVSQRTFPGS
jgi:hypothetical protein